MRVLVAGSHGQIGQRLVRLLSQHRHEVVAMTRDPAQGDELRGLGGEPLVADLEGDVSEAPAGCDAIVFTAGGGAGSGPEKKQTVDREGAEKLVDAAQRHGVGRYVMVSAIGVDEPEQGSEAMQPYLRAKQAADEYVRSSGLQFTIIRPGSLTDEPGEGRVDVAPSLGRRGQVARDNVADTVLAVLERDDLGGKTFELLDGDTPIGAALDGLR